MRTRAVVIGCGLMLAAGQVLAGDWPQFRGPAASGAGDAQNLPGEWSEQKNVAWKIKLPGPGWSQPIVVGDTIYLTAAVSDGALQGKDFDTGMPMSQSISLPAGAIDWRVIALDLKTGQTKWSQSVSVAKPSHPVHPSNTYATETPVADANGVYAYFGANGIVAALDPAGKPLWKKEVGAYKTTNDWGYASSLALHEGKIFLQSFNEEKAFVACLDTKTGDEKWRVTRDKAGTSWSSPIVWKNKVRAELIVSGQDTISGHDLETGKELWHASGVQVPTQSTTAADSERIYFGASGMSGAGSLYAVPAGASGDVSPAAGSTDIKGQSWAALGAAPGSPSPLVDGNFVYILNQNTLTVHDATTGQVKYKQSLRGMRNPYASPVAGDGKIILLSETGDAFVVKAGPTFEQISRSKLDDIFWSSPAVTSDSILFRGVEYLYCVKQ